MMILMMMMIMCADSQNCMQVRYLQKKTVQTLEGQCCRFSCNSQENSNAAPVLLVGWLEPTVSNKTPNSTKLISHI